MPPRALSSVPCVGWLRTYAWHPNCIRQWLFVRKGGRHEGGTWLQRMEHAVRMTLIAVLFGASVLIHCRQGKHRSGATGCFMFCLLTGCDFDDALRAYRSRNSRVRGHDVHIALDIWRRNNMGAALGQFRGQEWVRSMIGNILHKTFASPVPRPLSDDRSRSPQAKRRPKRRLRPTPKIRPASSSGDAAPLRQDEGESTVPPPPSDDVSRAEQARAEAEVARERTPSPPAERSLAWTCEACGNLNLRTSLHCSRAGCEGRLPQRLQEGDWECMQCGHMNRRWRDRCNWSHCPSNDWECPACGNYNYGDRRFCNGRAPRCAERRPRSLR